MLPNIIFLAVPAALFLAILWVIRRDYHVTLNAAQEKANELQILADKAVKKQLKSEEKQLALEEKLTKMIPITRYNELTQDLEEVNRKKNIRMRELQIQIDVMHRQSLELEQELKGTMPIEEHEQAIRELELQIAEQTTTIAGLEAQLEKVHFRLAEADSKLLKSHEEKSEGLAE